MDTGDKNSNIGTPEIPNSSTEHSNETEKAGNTK